MTVEAAEAYNIRFYREIYEYTTLFLVLFFELLLLSLVQLF